MAKQLNDNLWSLKVGVICQLNIDVFLSILGDKIASRSVEI